MSSGWRRISSGAGALTVRGGRVALFVATVSSAVATFAVPASPAEAGMEWPSSIVPHPETVSADVMPTVQIDGVVWAQEIVGNTVYVGGEFSNARPPGAAINTNETPRANFLAYDLNSGALITSIRFDTNGPVKALELSPDGSRLYVGGQFTQFGGQVRNRLAAIDIASNTIVPNFNPALNATVNAIDATADRVYVGGVFTAISSTSRDRLAAFDLNGGLIGAWDPRVDRSITSLVVSPDNAKVAIGGSFEVLNGSSTYRGLAFVNASNGDTLSMGAGNRIRNGGENGSITSLASDGDLVFGSGYCFGASCGTLEGRFALRWSDGGIHWIDDCHGDSYSVHPQGDVLYAVSHSHYCGNIGAFPENDPQVWRRATATTRAATGTIARDRVNHNNWGGTPRPDMLNWFPNLNAGTFTGQGQGAWTVTGNDRYVLLGGEFTNINGVAQQGLVRFQSRPFAANDQGPLDWNNDFPIKVWSDAAGKVTINWRANRDRDDADLTYIVHRRPVGTVGATLLNQRTLTAPYWNLPTMTFTDTTGTPGQAYEYRVQVNDGYGNVANTNWVTMTVASSGTRGTYLDAVLNSNPDSLWRLDEPSGSAAGDRVGWRDGTRVGGVAAGAGGVVSGSRASTFSGGTNSFIRTNAYESPPHEFSLEAWFRAPAGANGGLIVGFNSSNSDAGSSSTQDRVLYMDPQGRIQFGLNSDTPQTIGGSTNYRDNQWHYAVATSGPNGMQLYVDARLVAQNASLSNGGRTGYWGYWRIGGGAIDGFAGANSGSGRWFDGTLDEVALYKRQLPAGEIGGHYRAAGFNPPNQPPTADFGSTIRSPGDGRTLDFNATPSTDSDGTITRYRWNFGDGTAAVETTTPTVAHQFPAIRSYTVTLSVVDDDGAASPTISRSITTVDPTTLPVWADQTIGPMRVDTAYSDGVSATSTPPASYSLVRGSLPTGLDLDSVTGAITGTPTVVGPFAFTIRATNGVGTGLELSFEGVVNPPVDPLLALDVGPAGTLASGSPFTVSGVGFQPGSPVSVTLDGQPLAAGTVGPDEAVGFSGTLPTVGTGVHTLVASATAARGNAVESRQVFVVDWAGALGAQPNGAGYQGMQPKRVLDTRDGAGKLAAGTEYRLAVDESWGVPGDTVSVVLNVTATEPEDGGFLTVYPCGTQRPLASALNYQPGQTVPNLVVVPIGEMREICVYSLAASHVIADLNGYFAPSAPARIAGSQPVRLVDTRDTAKLAGGQVLEVQVTGEGKAPQGAQSAVINVTVTEPESAGFLTLFPCDQPMPTASNVNYTPGQTVANQAFVTLSATGTACVFTLSPAHVVLDMNAWFKSGETPELVSLVPIRVLDTRETVKIQAGQTIELPLAGAGGITGATGFAVNTTIAEPEGPGFVTFFPCGETMPLASSINFSAAGQVVANHTTAMVGANGATCIFASTATHVIVDVEGAYIPLG